MFNARSSFKYNVYIFKRTKTTYNVVYYFLAQTEFFTYLSFLEISLNVLTWNFFDIY